jgi:hypothetical protein
MTMEREKVATSNCVGSEGCKLFDHGAGPFIAADGGRQINIVEQVAGSWHAIAAIDWHTS